MRRALDLAAQGIGAVEPNPPVGAVVVDAQWRLIGEGRHERFGGAHAEVNALREAGESARGASLFVTLEPCHHHGKTPPCTAAIKQAGIARVIVATNDPADHRVPSGLAWLQEQGIEVAVGLLEEEAQRLIAPFTKLVTTGRPFVHAKWAMSLDGRIATNTGDSQWITSEEARAVAHRLRGRMDAIIIGIGTALADDPRLTVRPPGRRTPARIVMDSQARLPLSSQLVRTAVEAPVLVCCTTLAPQASVAALEQAGVEVLQADSTPSGRPAWGTLLDELGRRRMTNVFIEGGSEVLGSCFDDACVDWVHVFVGNKILGGRESLAAVGGQGRVRIADAFSLESAEFLKVGIDVYLHGGLSKLRTNEHHADS